MNPILPAGYDIAWAIVSFLVIALVVVALVSLARTAKRLTSTQALIWTLVTILCPWSGRWHGFRLVVDRVSPSCSKAKTFNRSGMRQLLDSGIGPGYPQECDTGS
jgi:uncharacterized membrane protein YhaH (DUF805 family)